MSLNYNYNYGLNIVNLTTGNLVSTNVTVNNIYYTGNLIQNGTVSSVLGSSNNYIATNLTTGTLNAGNLTTGNINFTGTLSQNSTPYLGSQWTTTSGNLSYTSGNVVVNNLTTGNLNFTGALSQNGAPYIGSQWTSTAGNISYTSGNVVVTNFVNSNASIGSLSAGNISISGNMTVGGNLLVSGSLISVNVTSVNVIDNNISAGTLNAVISSIGNLNSTNISTGTLYSNTISTTSISTINNTVTNLNSINITATNILANLITSTNLLATNNTLTNTIFTNFTVSNLLANNLNLGISSFFSSSFVAANNITTPTSINGLVFNNTNINYFEIKLSISIVATVNLSQTYNLYGNYNASGWSLFTNFIGDTTGVVFSITAAGQIQYTSTNIAGFVSDTFRYTVQQFSASGTYTSLAATTQGNYIFNTVQVTSTTDSIIGTSTGGIQILGGATISKQVNIQSTNNATGIGSGGSLTVFGGTAISGNMLIGGGISSSLNTNTIGNIFTTGGNVGIGNANPGFTLDVSGTARFTSSITTGSIFSTNITSTNILGTNITTTNLISNLITVNSLLSTNIFSSNITVTNLVASFTSLGNLTSSTGTFANQVGGSQTVGTLVITTSASLIGNTNTIGNLFTTGGNVGINTSSPGVTFDVIGSGRFTNLFASFTSLGNLTSSTGTFANKVGGSQTVGTLVITTSASLIGNTNTIGNLFTTGGNVGINTVTPGFTLDVSGTGRFTSSLTSGSHLIIGGGLLATFNTNTIGNLFTTGGNVGINTPTPAFTLDIAGSTRINNTLLATFNSNTIGNLFTTGGNVGINTTSPAYTLDVNGTSRISTKLDIGGTQPSFNSNTIGQLFLTGAVNNVNGGHIMLNTSQDKYPTFHLLNYSHDGIYMAFDTYFDGNNWRNSSSTTGFGIIKLNSQLQFNYQINTGVGNTGASPLYNTTAMVIGSTGNISINTNSGNSKLNIYNNISQSGTGDYSNIIGNVMTIQDNIYPRIIHLSQDGVVGAVFNFQTGKNIYWGEPSDTGSYIFRGRTLSVTSNGLINVAGGYYFGNTTSSIQPYNSGNQAISIFASAAILTQTNFLASSDLRIKNICDEEINLNLIDNINPVIYTYKDKIKNPKKNIGFIAQNVFEFCPEAVTLHKEIIPDIMKLVDIIENKDTIITIKNEWLLNEKDVIKIMVDDKDTVGELVDIIYSDKDVIKFKHLKLKNNVFIYGRQIEDFHELNYDYVFALGFAGIQKSRKEIKELKQDNILLTKGIKEQQQQINHQQKQINSLVELIKNKK